MIVCSSVLCLFQVLGFIAVIMCLQNKLLTLCGGSKHLPHGIDTFFTNLMEKGTLEYDLTDLEAIRTECWKALKLDKPKQDQVHVQLSALHCMLNIMEGVHFLCGVLCSFADKY
jgi:hypothetical protein